MYYPAAESPNPIFITFANAGPCVRQMMEKVASGKRPAYALGSIKAENDRIYPQNTIQMYFTSNHDENTWNGADYRTFPGIVHAPFAVFSQTMAGSVPLVYSGQEEPVLRAIKFFDKDPMTFQKLQRANFYKTLQELRTRNSALAADDSFRKVDAGDRTAIYAYVREKANKKVLVILNLSSNSRTVKLQDTSLLAKPGMFSLEKKKL